MGFEPITSITSSDLRHRTFCSIKLNPYLVEAKGFEPLYHYSPVRQFIKVGSGYSRLPLDFHLWVRKESNLHSRWRQFYRLLILTNLPSYPYFVEVDGLEPSCLSGGFTDPWVFQHPILPFVRVKGFEPFQYFDSPYTWTSGSPSVYIHTTCTLNFVYSEGIEPPSLYSSPD